VDELCDKFERAWRAGRAPRIEHCLEEADEADRPALLEKLLALELELTRAGDDMPTVDHCKARFPAHIEVIDKIFCAKTERSATAQLTPPARDATTAESITRDGNTGGYTDKGKSTGVRYFGDYELICELGRGGMGVVYKARHLRLNRLVALKLIRSAALASDDELRRFLNEAEFAARLDHPNIVPIFEVGQYEGQHYFSMKLVTGESLDKRRQEFVADPWRAARMVAATARAIQHAHERGILHRDLKPANILVDAEGQPLVTDFGLAKRVEGDNELTRSGAIMGTPAYMAPEQVSGSRGAVTTSTDVYGLGATLFALLTGRAPFGGTNVPDTLEQVRQRPPDLPSKVNRRVPRDLDVICLKCLEKEPDERYASAAALEADLCRFVSGEPIRARRVTPLERAAKWARRKPTLAAAYALGLLAAVLGGLGERPFGSGEPRKGRGMRRSPPSPKPNDDGTARWPRGTSPPKASSPSAHCPRVRPRDRPTLPSAPASRSSIDSVPAMARSPSCSTIRGATRTPSGVGPPRSNKQKTPSPACSGKFPRGRD
jgi:serine/threonine-protein kinase